MNGWTPRRGGSRSARTAATAPCRGQGRCGTGRTGRSRHPKSSVQRSETPLRGLWIDHVPNGAELAAMDLLYTDKLEQAQASPLATGDWESYPYAIWMSPHPEELTPQTTMPEPWFNHAEARQPPAALEDYEPAHGRTVRTVVGSSLSGSGAKEEAHKLPALWRRGLLTSAEERSLANHLLRNASAVQWYQIMLDEQWTVRPRSRGAARSRHHQRRYMPAHQRMGETATWNAARRIGQSRRPARNRGTLHEAAHRRRRLAAQPHRGNRAEQGLRAHQIGNALRAAFVFPERGDRSDEPGHDPGAREHSPRVRG